MSGRRAIALPLVLGAALAAAAPARAVPSAWGAGGYGLVPDASVPAPGTVEVGGRVLALTDRGRTLPLGSLELGVPGGPVGAGFELGVVYGVPGGTALAANAKLALVNMHRDAPTGVAVGVQLAEAAPDGSLGADLGVVPANLGYLVVSRNIDVPWGGQRYTLATATVGAMADTQGRARWMAALELPLGDAGGTYVEGLGPGVGLDAAVDVGLRYRVAGGIWLTAATLGVPGLDAFTQRAYLAGLAYDWEFPRVPGLPAAPPAPARPPAAVPTPAPAPVPAPGGTIPAPPPVPGPSLTGRALDGRGRPLAGYRVSLSGGPGGTAPPTASRQPDAAGDYLFGPVAPGSYVLNLSDPAGTWVASRSVTVVDEASEATLYAPVEGLPAPAPAAPAPAPQRAAPPGDGGASQSVAPALAPAEATLAGHVRRAGRPVGGVAVRLGGPGVTAVTVTDADGAFSLGGLPAGAYTLSVGRRRQAVRVPAKGVRQVDVALP